MGAIKITGSGSVEGLAVSIVDSGPGDLAVEGGIYQNGSPLTAWGFQTGLSFFQDLFQQKAVSCTFPF